MKLKYVKMLPTIWQIAPPTRSADNELLQCAFVHRLRLPTRVDAGNG
jgi:hypothetical protein